ncbi:MAG TPA: helix-turn-helix domain-containing protein [Pedococcus sp.]|nr:helix-turn-helix domain-containing protein [Pedococcus sp.]
MAAEPHVPGTPSPDIAAPGAAALRDRLAAAVGPLLDRVGGHVVDPAEAGPGDVPLVWDGRSELFVRLGPPPAGPGLGRRGSADLSDGLARLIAEVEAELGGSLSSLRRPEKQRAVRLLEERGAFEMRRSTETVAEALGVTRFTVYNYLNRARDPQG